MIINNNKPRIKLKSTTKFDFVKHVIKENSLNTVCEEANCPNIYECWDRKTATIMILGDICTRACGFCSVATGKPTTEDFLEPFRTAMAVQKMNLEHVVITSVDRDDLKGDYGSTIWAETIKNIHDLVPHCSVEVLTPDFKGHKPSLLKVFKEKPEIFSHNVECVERISKEVRTQANWKRSLDVLGFSVKNNLRTKTGMMVGLGERFDEVVDTMRQVSDLGVKLFTIGQYLQPTKAHLPVDRYVEEQEFDDYKNIGIEMGFELVKSGSLVRSSYHADEGV